jgi:hypothetical protein
LLLSGEPLEAGEEGNKFENYLIDINLALLSSTGREREKAEPAELFSASPCLALPSIDGRAQYFLCVR